MSEDAAGPILEEALLERIFQTEIAEYLVGERKPPQGTPEIVIVTGQFGASTGALHNELWREFADRGGIVPVRTEELRAFHPDYDSLVTARAEDERLIELQRSPAWIEHTDQAARWWTDRAMEHLVGPGHNIAVEDTYLTPASCASTAEIFSSLEYDVRVAAVSVPAAVSRLGILENFARVAAATGTGPWVDSEEHDASLENVLRVVVQATRTEVVDRIDIQGFEGTIYQFEHALNGAWRGVGRSELLEGPIAPVAMLVACRLTEIGQEQRTKLAERLIADLDQLADAGVAHREIWNMAGDVVTDLASHEDLKLPLDPRTMHNLNIAMLRVLDADAAPDLDLGHGGTFPPEPPMPGPPEPDVGPDL